VVLLRAQGDHPGTRMNEMFTRILNEALQLEGSEEALANRLHVPRSTLSRWLSGRAQTSLGAFLVTLQFIRQEERSAAIENETAPPADGPADKLVFPLGKLAARCARCDGTEFRAREGGKLRLTSVLRCVQCGAEVIHGDLLAQLATDAIHHTRAAVTRARIASQRSRERLDNDTQRPKDGEGTKLKEGSENGR
jgi:hypothetical protein